MNILGHATPARIVLTVAAAGVIGNLLLRARGCARTPDECDSATNGTLQRRGDAWALSWRAEAEQGYAALEGLVRLQSSPGALGRTATTRVAVGLRIEAHA
ncbi:MAG: hypothetical protein ABL900_17135 [Burkholderiaceae bacterium]